MRYSLKEIKYQRAYWIHRKFNKLTNAIKKAIELNKKTGRAIEVWDFENFRSKKLLATIGDNN